MKTCPFCAEEIQDAAIKCKHCGEFLDGSQPQTPSGPDLPWYYRTSTIVVAVLCVGPLALPLVWMRPRTRLIWKALSTIAIIALTWLLVILTQQAIGNFRELYELLKSP